MEWYVGQPIVAIRHSNCGAIKKNDEFIIKGINNLACCNRLVFDVGLRQPSHYRIGELLHCKLCNGRSVNTDNIKWKIHDLFAPLDVDISELTEILEQPIVKEIEIELA